MNISVPKSQFLLYVALYVVGFALLARNTGWMVYVPIGVAVVALHLYITSRRKRARYRSIVESAQATRIECFPVFVGPKKRSIDDVVIDSLKEVTAELEKKCFQLVEKNIQLLSLKEISLTIISSLNEARIVDSVRSYLSKGLGFKEIFVGIFNDETHALNVYAFREAVGQTSHSESRLELGELQGLLRKSIISRKPVLIRDPEMHPIGNMNGQSMFADSTMESYLIVPMVRSTFSQTCFRSSNCLLKAQAPTSVDSARIEDAVCSSCGRVPVLGAIGVTDGFKANALSQVDLVAVETLALQISTLLENSQLYTELQQEESFRENVINSMMNGLITVDTDGRILLANGTSERLTGYSGEELRAMNVDEVIIDHNSDRGPGPVKRTLPTGKKMLQKEALLVKKDGTRLPILLNTSLLRDEDEAVQGAIAVFLDITQIKRMEQRILHLDKLAALGRFSSSMAHEIRNPLTGIVAGIQYLRRVGGIPDNQQENISFILSEVNRIDRLIADILNVVRVGDLLYQPAQMEAIVDNSIGTIRNIAEARSIRLVTDFPKETRPVMVDSDRITQVVINLLKNAVEASPDGARIVTKVSFPRSVEDVMFDESTNFVIIEIEDEGSGFTEEETNRIFEPFFTTKSEGTGLGLYVTHSIVERHGGYILVESEKGKGSVFTVYLPVEKVEYGDSSEVSHPVG